MKIAILGLGESLDQIYTDTTIGHFDLTIGVNDIWSKHKTDFVVCVDRPDRFTPERLEIINNCCPKRFYSQLDDWSRRSDFYRIKLQPDYPNHICQLGIPAIPKSFCSPFIAAAIAFKLHDAGEIHLFGVDLLTHPNLHDQTVERIRRHFINLRDALAPHNVRLVVHGNGALRSVTN